MVSSRIGLTVALTKVAFIGLGVMGYPMAGWLSRNGHQVTVYNRTASVAQRWAKTYTGRLADSPRAAALGADVVFTCVGNDNDVKDVVLGDQGALAGMHAGATLVDHTTTSAQLARELAERAADLGCQFIDAPVSGGQQGAENGQLTIMCGGQAPLFDSLKPLLCSYARAVTLMGPNGSGQLCKMVNQICIAGLLQGLAEGLHFAENAGLDPQSVIEVISKGAAQSWQMENRYQTMLAGEYNHGFAVEWMRKDLAFALEEAQRNASELPVTELVDQFYADIERLGGSRWDTSSLLARLKSRQ